MPPRTSAASSNAHIKSAVTYHATAITIFWVVGLFFSLAISLVLVVYGSRIDALSKIQRSTLVELQRAKMELQDLNIRCTPAKVAAPVSAAPAAAAAMPAYAGILTRGSYSPDGTKYAGYDDATKGKIGIGVQVTGEARVRHIELFDTKAETSGAGTAQESTLSVRWTDKSTIEFDVLVKKGSAWVKETRTTKIFF